MAVQTTFGTLQVGLSGLQAQQTALNVTGENITNANTPGYAQEQAVMAASPPLTNYPAGEAGTGVTVQEIQRITSAFLDQQVRSQQGLLSQWQSTQNSLQEVQAIFNEPSSTGIQSSLNAFWSSLQQLADNPADPSVRTAVVQQGKSLATSVNTVFQQLVSMQQDLNKQVVSTVGQINSYAQQIATLNGQIVAVQATGQQPGALADNRAQILNQLSSLINVTVRQESSGADQVFIGGVPLVDNTHVNQLSAQVAQNGGPANSVTVAFSSAGTAASINAGELSAQLQMTNQTIPSYEQQLNTFAAQLAGQVNALQLTGYDLTGVQANSYSPPHPFFDAAGAEVDQGTSTSYTAAASGSFQIGLGAGAGSTTPVGTVYTVNVASGATLSQIALDINQQAGAAVYASVTAGGVLQLQGVVPGQDILYNPTNTGGQAVLTGTGVDTAATVGTWSGGTNVVTQPSTTQAASTLAVDASVANDPAFIAAAQTPNAPGDGSNAQAMAGLSTTALPVLNSASLGGYYDGIISTLGLQGQQSNQMVQNFGNLVTQLTNQQQSVSGVSLDQEATNMIRYQQAYGAAADFINTLNTVLNTLIQQVG